MSRFLLSVTAFLIATSAFCLESQADIQYSWAGKIFPSGTDDPWTIGPDGKSFSLSAVVPESAADILGDSVQFSAFNLITAHLFVDRQDLAYVGNGDIDFTDNSAGIMDLVRIDGDFHWFGTAVGIESAVALMPTTFSFAQPGESLPIFSSTTNLDHFATGGRYTLIVEAGSAVTVIPEPKSILLCLVAIVLVPTRRNNRLLDFWRYNATAGPLF